MEVKRLITIDEQFEAGKEAFIKKEYEEACKLLRLALSNLQEPPCNNDIIFWLEKAELCRKHFYSSCFYQELEFYEEALEHLEQVYPFVEEMEWPFNSLLGSVYHLKQNSDGQYGYSTESKEWIIKPSFDEAHPFREAHARVRIKNKWGFIDRRGVLVVKAIYDKVEDFENGLALVERDGQHFVVNKLGIELEQVEVD